MRHSHLLRPTLQAQDHLRNVASKVIESRDDLAAIDSALDAARKAGVDQADLKAAQAKHTAGDAKLQVS